MKNREIWVRAAWFFIGLLLFALVIFTISKYLDQDKVSAPFVVQVKLAPDFTVSERFVFNRQPIQLTNYKGKPLLLHFWATWCAPCINELPELLNAAQAIREQGVQLVAIAEDDNWTTLDVFFRQHPNLARLKSESILILDSDRRISDLYDCHQFPETFFLTRDMKIEKIFIGAQSWGNPEMKIYLSRSLNN